MRSKLLPPERLILIPLLLVGVAVPAVSAAADSGTGAWPQWGGPDRDFTVPAVEIATTWPADGPEQLWHRELGDDGYSGIVAAGGRLFTWSAGARTK